MTYKVMVFGDILLIHINKTGSIAKLTQLLIHEAKMKILDQSLGSPESISGS